MDGWMDGWMGGLREVIQYNKEEGLGGYETGKSGREIVVWCGRGVCGVRNWREGKGAGDC